MTTSCTEHNYNNQLPGNVFLRMLQETVCFTFSCVIVRGYIASTHSFKFQFPSSHLLRLFNFRHENEDDDVNKARKALNAAPM